MRLMETVITAQELYIYKAVDGLIEAVRQTYVDFIGHNESVSVIVFYCFLAFQLLTILLLRSYLINSMKNDMMQSRGILNLVPSSFLKDH